MEQSPMFDSDVPSTGLPDVGGTQGSGQPASGGTAASPVAPERAGGGWTAVGDADYDVIRKKRPDCAPTVFAVWYVLIREARFRRSARFSLSDAIVADRACCARRTAIKARRTLVELGLLRCWQKRSQQLGNEPTEYELCPSILPVRGGRSPCATVAQPPCALHEGASDAHTLRVQIDENTSICTVKRARSERARDFGVHARLSGIKEEKTQTDAGPVDTTVPAFLGRGLR